MAGIFQAKAGKVAIWTGKQDDAPFDNPLGNINRVKFHSDLDYVRVIEVRKYTLIVPAIPASGSGQGDPGVRTASYNLGAHGQGRIPWLVGFIKVDGVPLAFTGSVHTHTAAAYDANSIVDFGGRFLALGADATNIYVHEYSMQTGNKNTGVWVARPQQSFALEIGITNVSL